jgi:hypothetical protein
MLLIFTRVTIIIFKWQQKKYWWEYRVNKSLIYCLWKGKLYSHSKNNWTVYYKRKYMLTLWLSNSSPECLPENENMWVLKLCTSHIYT